MTVPAHWEQRVERRNLGTAGTLRLWEEDEGTEQNRGDRGGSRGSAESGCPVRTHFIPPRSWGSCCVTRGLRQSPTPVKSVKTCQLFFQTNVHGHGDGRWW